MIKNELAVYAAVAIVALAIGYVLATGVIPLNLGGGANNSTATGAGTLTVNIQVPSDKIAKLQDALEIFYSLQAKQKVTLTYKNVTDNGEFYVVNFALPDGSDAPGIYISKDFKYIYGDTNQKPPTIDEIYTRAQQLKSQLEQQATVQVKSDKPKVEVFVMSYCPYGMQMEQAIIPVQELLGDKADIQIKFVGYTMHGETEINENTRQYCMMQNQPDKFWAYLKCFVGSKDANACMNSTGIDSANVSACIAETNTKYGINETTTERYPKYPIHAAENSLYGVQGSPTVVINGQTVNMPRTPEGAKQMICSAFNVAPEECNTTLAGSATPSPSGGCGA